jgi:hypothetical protein
MTHDLKIALAQLNPTVGDVAGNLAMLRKARASCGWRCTVPGTGGLPSNKKDRAAVSLRESFAVCNAQSRASRSGIGQPRSAASIAGASKRASSNEP